MLAGSSLFLRDNLTATSARRDRLIYEIAVGISRDGNFCYPALRVVCRCAEYGGSLGTQSRRICRILLIGSADYRSVGKPYGRSDLEF